MTLRKKQEKNVEKKRGNHAMHVTKLTELPNGIDMKCQEEISNYFSPNVFFLSQLFCFKFVHFHFQRWTTCKMTWKYKPFHFFPQNLSEMHRNSFKNQTKDRKFNEFEWLSVVKILPMFMCSSRQLNLYCSQYLQSNN